MSTTPSLKRKRNDDNNWPAIETPQTTSDTGLKLIDQLKRAQDKTGRDVAIHFLDLPSRDEYPDYFEKTAMPLSVNEIEQRLEDFQYNTMTELEGDLKRMVQNAKDYNDSRSEVFADAERIRKALSNFMPKNNKAYEHPDYRAVPTPIPQALLDRLRQSSVSTNGAASTPPVQGPVKLVLKNRQSTAPPTDTEEDLQDKIMDVLDELSNQDSAINFEKKPPKRDYPDYYKVIEHPTSISDVRSLIKQGKIADWDSFSREVRLIWENAKEYNEEDSPIYELTETLEAWFEERMQKEGVQRPRKLQRLSLSQPKKPGIKLRLGGSTPTPTVTGGTVDNDSLRRQKEEMSHALHESRGTVVPTPTVSTAPSMRRSLSSMDHNDIAMTDVNGHGAVHQEVNGSKPSLPPGMKQLPTPVMEGVPPLTNGVNGIRTNGIHQAPNRNTFMESDNPIDRKHREPGQGLQDALLASVVYMTHPNLPGDPKWKLTRYASANKTQTTSYIYLPADHFYFRIVPSLTAELKSRNQWKLVVSANWQTVTESQQVPGAWDFRLQPGENSIVVDVIAELKLGVRKEYAKPQMQFDFERIQLVVVLVDRSTE